tara:strand:+ start:2945 stop:3181 length:237 start_codon:yes stop_codon:yes gene_type:complete
MNSKNKLKIGFGTLAIVTFIALGTTTPAEARSFGPCDEGQPADPTCAYWDIKYVIGEGQTECNTGGKFVCEKKEQTVE